MTNQLRMCLQPCSSQVLPFVSFSFGHMASPEPNSICFYYFFFLFDPLWPSMTSTPGATTTNSTTYSSAFTTTAITSNHFKTQSLTSLCTNPSPPPPSRSNWKSNLSRCCVQVERRTATTACSLFRSLSTAHICIDLSSFWAGGTGGSNTKRLIPIDLHRALRFHSSFIW